MTMNVLIIENPLKLHKFEKESYSFVLKQLKDLEEKKELSLHIVNNTLDGMVYVLSNHVDCAIVNPGLDNVIGHGHKRMTELLEGLINEKANVIIVHQGVYLDLFHHVHYTHKTMVYDASFLISKIRNHTNQ